MDKGDAAPGTARAATGAYREWVGMYYGENPRVEFSPY